MAKTVEKFLKPSRIAEDLVARLKGFAIPGVDAEALMATQRKNIEALANASRTALDGARAVGKRQAEILQQAMSETARALEAATKVGSAVDIAATQAELMKQGFEKALRSMRELAEMVSKAQHGAVDAIVHRVDQSVSEIRHATLKPTDVPAAQPQPTATTH